MILNVDSDSLFPVVLLTTRLCAADRPRFECVQGTLNLIAKSSFWLKVGQHHNAPNTSDPPSPAPAQVKGEFHAQGLLPTRSQRANPPAMHKVIAVEGPR